MTKHHAFIFLGAVAVGYLMASTLVNYQPFKFASTAVGNL